MEKKVLHNHTHTHVDEFGNVYTHTHDVEHIHDHDDTKAILNRMSRAIGHMESIKRMIEDGRDYGDVLIQLSAVKSAIQGVSREILKDHISHSIADAKDGDDSAIVELEKAIDQFMK